MPTDVAREARAFHIWREGTSVSWEVTPGELAELLGIEADEVAAICRERRWPVLQPSPKDQDPQPLTF